MTLISNVDSVADQKLDRVNIREYLHSSCSLMVVFPLNMVVSPKPEHAVESICNQGLLGQLVANCPISGKISIYRSEGLLLSHLTKAVPLVCHNEPLSDTTGCSQLATNMASGRGHQFAFTPLAIPIPTQGSARKNSPPPSTVSKH